MLAAWVHDLSPDVFSILGLTVRWYGVSYLGGFVCGWLILRAMARRGLVLIPADRAMDAILVVVFGVVLGGRLGYVLFYKRALLLEFSRDFPWWGVLKIHQGGMASHGGMIGVMIAAWMVSRGFRNEEGIRVGRCPVLHVYDACAIMSTPGLFFGRLANFVNGELLGHIVAAPGAAAPWWSVKYPQELVSGHAPVLTDAQTVELVRLVQPFLPASGNFAQGVERMIVRLHAGDAELATKLGALLAARHPSQLYQAGAEGIVLAGVLWFVWMKPRKPGVVAGWFLVAYAVLRIIIEQFFRLPDADIPGAVVLGFSRGQWLSAGILMVGAALWLVAARSAGARLGGWGAKA